MDTFVHSSFGTVVMTLFQGLFTAPSWQTFTYLACGWALATDRHTITTYLWLTGATTVKHFSRFYVFLGCPLYNRRWQLWGAVIRLAAQFVPEGEVIRVIFDDTTKKKAGTPYRGARPLPQWRRLSPPRIPHAAGLELRVGHHAYSPHSGGPATASASRLVLNCYLKPEQAKALNVPYRSRSQLARDILDFMAEQLPGRPIRSLADGGYATKDYVRQLPDAVHVVGRLPISAKLYTLPPTADPKASRRPAQKRRPDRLAQDPGADRHGLVPHPSEDGAEIQAWCGLWHSVLPGRLIRVVVLRRDGKRCHQTPWAKKTTPSPRSLFHHRSDVEPPRHLERV